MKMDKEVFVLKMMIRCGYVRAASGISVGNYCLPRLVWVLVNDVMIAFDDDYCRTVESVLSRLDRR